MKDLEEKSLQDKYKDGDISKEAYVHITSLKILSKLKQLDEESTRPLRAILTGKETDEDRKKLEENEIEAQQLREELQELFKL